MIPTKSGNPNSLKISCWRSKGTAQVRGLPAQDGKARARDPPREVEGQRRAVPTRPGSRHRKSHLYSP